MGRVGHERALCKRRVIELADHRIQRLDQRLELLGHVLPRDRLQPLVAQIAQRRGERADPLGLQRDDAVDHPCHQQQERKLRYPYGEQNLVGKVLALVHRLADHYGDLLAE